MRTTLLVTLLGALALAGCAGSKSATLRPVDVPAPAPELARARAAADSLTKGLAGLLFSTLESEGPVAATRVCSDVAQSVTAGYAEGGLAVRRVGTRLRNPANRPDSREAAALERFAAAIAAGNPPGEVSEVLEGGGTRVLAYVRPIVLQPRCTACHGPLESIDPAVRAMLRERYPADAAVGYAAGELRGAVSVRVTLASPR